MNRINNIKSIQNKIERRIQERENDERIVTVKQRVVGEIKRQKRRGNVGWSVTCGLIVRRRSFCIFGWDELDCGWCGSTNSNNNYYFIYIYIYYRLIKSIWPKKGEP